MKKRLVMALSVVLIIVVLLSAFVIMQSYSLSKKPFYVGVTYCGNSIDEAKVLIDKVKNYTNLFILQSGPLQENLTATKIICDYAVDCGLDIIVYYGSYYSNRAVVSAFLNVTKSWGEHFLGLYYGDEPGGKMLDTQLDLYENTDKKITKYRDGDVSIEVNDTEITFFSSGLIELFNSGGHDFSSNIPNMSWTKYYTNGTITYQTLNETLTYNSNGIVTSRKIDGSVSTVTNRGNISQFTPYQKLWASRPIQTYNEGATDYLGNLKQVLGWLQNQSSVKTFTSDYGLYWFDYLGGYNVVLTEFGWNHTDIQHMALVRGAANMQNKEWGAMLTWKSNEAPYLARGEEMFNQMSLAYDNGAQYVIVFNYSPDNNGIGLLQDEHFEALQRFWNEKVLGSQATCKSSTAEAALVLPRNYGWGMRNPSDTIWGLWQPDDKSTQIWNALQEALAEYGTKLDIIFDDQNFPVAWHYKQVIYWNKPI